MNIETSKSKYKGNGGKTGFPVGKRKTQFKNGCFKHNDCDTCKIPVKKCSGNYVAGKY